MTRLSAVIVSVEWGGGGRVSPTKGEDASCQGGNRTDGGVAGTTEANAFPANTVLLHGEFEGGVRGRSELGFGGSVPGKAGGVVGEVGVAETEGSGTSVRRWCCGVSGKAIFAGPEKEEECQNEHVRSGVEGWGVLAAAQCDRGGEQLGRHGLNAPRWWVVLGVTRQETLEAKI